MRSIAGVIKKRIAGALLIALGVLTLTMPLVAGRWSLAVLGLPLIAMGIAEAYIAFTSPRGTEASAYLSSALALLGGNVLLLSSALVGHGLFILLIAILMVDGFGKIIAALRRSQSDRLPLVINGLVDLACAALVWYLSRFIGVVQAIGIIVGAYIVARGLAVANGAGRAGRARYNRQSLERSPGPRARRPREREFCPFAFRDRQRVAVRALRRSIVDVNARDRIPGDPCRPDAANR